MTAPPRPKLTRADSEEAVLARHVFRDAYGACVRCGNARASITYSRLACISDARAAGNAAIGRIVARGERRMSDLELLNSLLLAEVRRLRAENERLKIQRVEGIVAGIGGCGGTASNQTADFWQGQQNRLAAMAQQDAWERQCQP